LCIEKSSQDQWYNSADVVSPVGVIHLIATIDSLRRHDYNFEITCAGGGMADAHG
jgi:hypothetical protein